MSQILTQAEQREALAFAVNGLTTDIDGETVRTSGYVSQPAVPQAYDAWPVWVATRPVAMCADEKDWQVLLALPGTDPQTWCATGDALVETITAALDDWDLTRIEPVQILLAEGASMPGLQFTVTI
jgi:hypothetical protein